MPLTNNVTMSLQGGDRAIVWGTCMLGDTFGQITGCDITETGDMDVILDALGAARSVMFLNPGFEVEIEALFDIAVDPPKTGDTFLMPYIDLLGTVVPGTAVGYKDKASRTLKFKVHRWNSLDVSLGDGDVKVFDYSGQNGQPIYNIHVGGYEPGFRPAWAPAVV